MKAEFNNLCQKVLSETVADADFLTVFDPEDTDFSAGAYTLMDAYNGSSDAAERAFQHLSPQWCVSNISSNISGWSVTLHRPATTDPVCSDHYVTWSSSTLARAWLKCLMTATFVEEQMHGSL